MNNLTELKERLVDTEAGTPEWDELKKDIKKHFNK